MEGSLLRESLGRSLGSHDAAGHAGGTFNDNDYRKETTRLHAVFCPKTGCNSLIHNGVLHEALARSLRESRVQFVVEDTWPFQMRASGQNGRSNPLQTDIKTETGALFYKHPRRKNRAFLLDITIVKLCACSKPEKAARHAEKHLTDAVK